MGTGSRNRGTGSRKRGSGSRNRGRGSRNRVTCANSFSKKVFGLTRARRSGGVIWFGEGSPKEGDRIIAWYKSEWELGLSWVFTGPGIPPVNQT